jgi:RNA-directed DNA polymerase
VQQGKAFKIPKALVWRSYKEVRKNGGAPGCDGQTLTDFDKERDKNLYKIWNRLSSGSYFPPAVREKRIPKEDGSERVLGIPTVSDRVAQGAVKLYVEERLEPLFHDNSYGYRPGRSAHQALKQCQQECWKKRWVLEVDIKSFFDTVNHELVLKALAHHRMPSWVILYCTRWLQAPMEMTGAPLILRTKGTPQGGVISPLLANLFLHYAFDMWMEREHKNVSFERYADDIVCHCKSMKEALALKAAIKARLESVGLAFNEEKSTIAYIDTFQRWNVKTSFTFLGYDFTLRILKSPKGELFRKCMPGASKRAMRKMTKTVRGWKMHRSTVDSIEVLATRHNPTLRGWIEYYGKFWYRNFGYRLWSVVQSRLLKWIKSKYRLSSKEAEHRLSLIRRERPKLFAHWYLLRAENV